MRALTDLVRRYKPDVVHFHNTFPLISPAAYYAVRRHGAAVILEPLETGWDWLDRISAPLDGDFEAAALEVPGDQARPELDRFD